MNIVKDFYKELIFEQNSSFNSLKYLVEAIEIYKILYDAKLIKELKTQEEYIKQLTKYYGGKVATAEFYQQKILVRFENGYIKEF